MPIPLPAILLPQFEAALAMFRDCLVMCPPEHWDTRIAHYTFSQVAYHTLCFVDVYLSPGEAAFEFRTTNSPQHAPPPRHLPLHPRGRSELEDEFPSRRFEQDELLAYLQICRDKLHTSMAAETEATLAGPSGFPRLKFSRAELHLYNLRHIQHHTGALSACLRRVSNNTIDPRWVGTGWRD
jgi:hypothetical protein